MVDRAHKADRDVGWTTHRPGVTFGMTPFQAVNAADITTTTAVAIKAGVAGSTIWITSCIVANSHATEDTTVILQSDNGTPVEFAHLPAPAMDINGGVGALYTFDPPIKVVAGDGVEGIGVTATTGDVRMSISGFIGVATDDA